MPESIYLFTYLLIMSIGIDGLKSYLTNRLLIQLYLPIRSPELRSAGLFVPPGHLSTCSC